MISPDAEAAAKSILRVLMELPPNDRLDVLAIVAKAWIEHPEINELRRVG